MLYMPVMNASKTFGKQGVQGLSQDLQSRIPERLLRPLVEEANSLLFIDRNDRIGGDFHDPRESCFRGVELPPQRLGVRWRPGG